MVCLEGFYLSHTYEAVCVPTHDEVARFLPPYRSKVKLDPDDPHTFHGGTGMDVYMEFRYKLQQAMELAKLVIPEVGEEFGRVFGRRSALLEAYRTDGAETILRPRRHPGAGGAVGPVSLGATSGALWRCRRPGWS